MNSTTSIFEICGEDQQKIGNTQTSKDANEHDNFSEFGYAPYLQKTV